MIPKKLFNNKCLHPDREIIFAEDLQMFYNLYILNLINPSSKIKNIIKSEITRQFQIFKNTNSFISQQNQEDDIKLNSNEEIEFDETCKKLEVLSKSKDYITKISNPSKMNSDNHYYSNSLINEILIDKRIFYEESFKTTWKELRMSLIHHSKSKEENTNEYYQELFKEIQLYLFPDEYSNLISKIFGIYALYSFYNTQIYKIKFQITTILECLSEINITLEMLKTINFSLFKSLYSIINYLYISQAFKFGVIIGLKTMILNKYALPIEVKSGLYKEYKEVFKNNEKINDLNYKENHMNSQLKPAILNYKSNKFDVVNEIKDLFDSKDTNDAEIFCEEVNLNKSINKKQYGKKLNNISLSCGNNLYSIEDLKKSSISKLDINLNQFDDSLYMYNSNNIK